MSIESVVNQAVSEIDFGKIIKDQVKESISKSVKSTIEDQFSWNGNGKKLIEEAFGKIKMPESLDILDYRDFMIESCIDAIKSFQTEEEKLKIKEHVKNLIGLKNTSEMSIHEIFEKLSENYQTKFEEDPCGCFSDSDELKLQVLEDNKYCWFNVHLFENGERVASLTVSTSDNKVFHHRIHEKRLESGGDTLFRNLSYYKTKITDLGDDKELVLNFKTWQESKY